MYNQQQQQQQQQQQPSSTPSATSLPWPVPELLRSSPSPFSTAFLLDTEVGSLLSKAAEWTLFFAIGAAGLGYGWVLLLAALYHLRVRETRRTLEDTVMAK